MSPVENENENESQSEPKAAAACEAIGDATTLARHLRAAHDANQGLIYGYGPEDPARHEREGQTPRLTLAGLDRVIHHDPGDQSITVEPGMRLDHLQEALAADGQMLAAEAPLGPSAIGDLLLAGDGGFCALRHGPLREQVLGLTVLLPDGRRCRSGGRTAKNVTGYDLNRLHCGGRGFFGVPVEVSLRLRPRPKMQTSWRIALAHRNEALALAQILHGLPHRLSALVAFDGSLLTSDRASWCVALRIDGDPRALESADAAIKASLKGSDTQLTRLENPKTFWPRLLEKGRAQTTRDADLLVDFGRPRLSRDATRSAANEDLRREVEGRLRDVFDPRGVLQRGRWPEESRR